MGVRRARESLPPPGDRPRRSGVSRTATAGLIAVVLAVLTGVLGSSPAPAVPAERAAAVPATTADITDTTPTPTASIGTGDAGTSGNSDSVQVTLQSMLPSIPVPKQPVRLTGIAVNTGSLMVTGKVRAEVCIDRTAIVTPTGLAAVPDRDEGGCRAITNEPGSDKPLWQELGEQLAPGQRVGVDVTVPWDALGISNNGVYVIGIKIVGTVGGERVTAGTSRTTMPLINKGTQTRQVRLMLGVPLTYRPTQLASGAFVTNALTGQLTGTGRLGELLTAGQDQSGRQAPVTWLADPSMLAEIRAMAGGYQVRTENGLVPGPNRAIAANWLKRFTAAQKPGYPAVLLPYADPDVAGLAANNQGGLVADAAGLTASAQAQAPTLYGHQMRSGSWSENADPATTGALSVRQPQLNLISTDSWSASSLGDVRNDPFVSVAGGRNLPAVAVNPSLVAGGPDTGRTPTALSLRQRLLSETALSALQGTGSATMAAIEPRTLDPSGIVSRGLVAALEAPWVTPIGADQLRGDHNGPTVPAPAGDASKTTVQPAPSTVDEDVAGQLATLTARISLIGQILSRPAATTAVFRQAALRSASLGFSPAEYGVQARGSPIVGTAEAGTVTTAAQQTHAMFLRDNLQLAQGQFAQVRILRMKLVTLSGRNGRFPLTIENDLGQTVRVRVRITGLNRTDLRIVQDPGPITIGANRKATVTIVADAGANGLVYAQAALVAPNGASTGGTDNTIGSPSSFVIQVASYTLFGWALVVGAAVLLLGTSGLRIARRIRRERQGRADHPPEDATAKVADGIHDGIHDGGGPRADPAAPVPAGKGASVASGAPPGAHRSPGDRVETEPDA